MSDVEKFLIFSDSIRYVQRVRAIAGALGTNPIRNAATYIMPDGRPIATVVKSRIAPVIAMIDVIRITRCWPFSSMNLPVRGAMKNVDIASVDETVPEKNAECPESVSIETTPSVPMYM